MDAARPGNASQFRALGQPLAGTGVAPSHSPMQTNRRVAARVPRRVPVSVRKPDDVKPFMAITTNVSTSGLFVATHRLYPRGTRLLVTESGSADIIIEVEVARIVRIDPALGSGGQTGMGMRLVGRQVETAVTPAAAAPASAPGRGLYAIAFRNAEEFLEVLKRDLKLGGAFVRSSTLPNIQEIVDVEIRLPAPLSRTLRFAGRVVYRREEGDKGFGVQFLDKAGLVAALLKRG